MEIKLPKRLDGKEQTLVTNGNQITVQARAASAARLCRALATAPTACRRSRASTPRHIII